MKKLFKFFILLNITIVCTLAICSDRPAIPTTPPFTITRSSPGISNFPTSTKQFAMTLRATPNEPCTAGSIWNIFSLSLQPPGGVPRERFLIYIDCDSRTIRFEATWLSSVYVFPTSFSSFALGPFSVFWYMDLSARSIRVLAQTDLFLKAVAYSLTIPSGLSIDENAKFYLCSSQDGTSSRACTISELVFEYRLYEGKGWPHANLGGTDPAIAAFYPLTDGPKTSLTNSLDPIKHGYFGDKESNPTEGTLPTWDSSNSFVIISSGQFLTFPLPSLLTTIYPYFSSFTFTAWLKISELQPAATTTIFSMHSADGTQVGYKLTVDQSTQQLQLSFGSLKLSTVTAHTPITLQASDAWQLIGFTAHLKTGKRQSVGLIFAGTSSYQFNGVDSKEMDVTKASVIRIGGASESFSGHISYVRIITPGAATIKSSNLCLPDTSIEFGLGSFPLACSGSTMMGSADNKCYSSCPSDTFFSSDTATLLCVACPIHCLTCDRIECFTCEEKYILYQGSCLSSCPDKMYYDGTTCQKCPSNCKDCDQSQCLSCNAKDLLYKGDCVSSCPAKTYSTSSACYDCSVNCEMCSSNQCLDCAGTFLLYQGDCVGSCPAKTYSTSSACLDCSINCEECSSTECLTCNPSFFLYKGNCVNSCPSKTYSEGSACYDCSTKCSKCENAKCLVCEENSFFYQDGCVDSCPAKTFPMDLACHDCPINCAKCESGKCLACEANHLLSQGDCVSSCPAKTYSDGSACQNCPAGCNVCDDKECTTCASNFLFYQGSCLSSCPLKTYSDGSICQSCPSGCNACESTQCFTCDEKSLFYQGNCLSSCPVKTYSANLACHDCPKNCETCQSSKCLTCGANYLLSHGDCVESCPPRSYSDLTSCIACSDQCIECKASGCQVCGNDYQLDADKKCVSKPSSRPSTVSTEEAGSSGSISGGLIAGIVCGSVAAVAFTGFLIKKYLFNIKRIGLKNRYLDNQVSSAREPTTPVSPIQTEENELIP